MKVKRAGPLLLRDWIDRAARRDPDKPFIISVDQEKTISFGQFRLITQRLACYLHGQGIGANERVALLANNSIEHLICFLGVMAYGATICTIHVEMNRHHFQHILPVLRPRFVLYDEELQIDDILIKTSSPNFPLGNWDTPVAGSFFSALALCNPSDDFTEAEDRSDSCILFTSGTLKRPKGVVLSFREHLLNIEPIVEAFELDAGDRIYDFRSFNWASAQLLGALTPLCCGATLIMAKKFSRSQFFSHIRKYGATVAAGNPTTINLLLNSDEPMCAGDVPSLRFITSSSAPLLLEEWQRFEDRFGIRIAQGYGSTETGWIAGCAGTRRKLGTVGKPLPYHKLAIVNAEGKSLPAGEIGYVEVGAFPDHEYRYLGEDGFTEIADRGRTKTGDMGFLDADGYLHLTGREKDLIIRGGVNISPLEIDSILMQRPEVIEAATIGVPHKVYGEEVVSYVVLRPATATSSEELMRHCNEILPPFKAPKEIVLSSQLPKSERGKLDRKALLAEWLREHA